jgi:Flp pilus assembly protein TadG
MTGRLARDRGGISILLAIGLTAIMTIIGLSVDGGGELRAQQRANDIAAEAARAGGQAIDVQKAISGTPPTSAQLLPNCPAVATEANCPVVRAVDAYLAQAGATGTVTIAADHAHLTVTVTIVYHTVMISFLGFDTYTVTGRATAALETI